MKIIKKEKSAGFTLVEAIISSVIFVMVAGMAIMLLVNTMSGYSKGESASTSVQEASLIISRLRADLLQSTFSDEGEPYDFYHSLKTQNENHGTLVNINSEAGTVSTTATDIETDGEILKFFVNKGNTKQIIQYRYSKDQRSIFRKVGTKKERAYAVPRLQNFSIHMYCQKTPTDESAEPTPSTSPDLLFSDSSYAPARTSQIWFKIIIDVKEEEVRENHKTKEVNIEAMIFPKQLNKSLQSRWKQWN